MRRRLAGKRWPLGLALLLLSVLSTYVVDSLNDTALGHGLVSGCFFVFFMAGLSDLVDKRRPRHPGG